MSFPETQYLWSWRVAHGYFVESDEEIEFYETERWRWKDTAEERYGWWSAKKWAYEFQLLRKEERSDGNIDADDVRGLITLSEVVGQYTQLKRTREHEWLGRCPFHEDRLPSFSVSDRKGLWHCFSGCGSGNVFHFLMRIEQLDFRQALSLAAQSI